MIRKVELTMIFSLFFIAFKKRTDDISASATACHEIRQKSTDNMWETVHNSSFFSKEVIRLLCLAVLCDNALPYTKISKTNQLEYLINNQKYQGAKGLIHGVRCIGLPFLRDC